MKVKIANKIIGDNRPAFLIAELSANHLQRIDMAIKAIKEAKKTGVDAVKIQTYTPETMTIDVDNKYFRVKHPKWGGQTLYQLYQKAYTPWGWFKKLKRVADDLDLILFSTAFDKTAVDFLEDQGVPAHKIASFELVDLPLIEYAARTGKPLIMSTGMASLAEIREAVHTAKKAGAKDIILLKCVSSYPARPEDMNLRTILRLKEKFSCPIGLSDHTLGIGTALAAVTLGATVVEKHFTLSRKLKTPDSFFSMEPHEWKMMIDNIRIVEKALGTGRFALSKEEKKSLVFRRSLFVTKDIKKGDTFTEDNVRSIRPAVGLKPKYLRKILGRKAKKSLKKGMPVTQAII